MSGKPSHHITALASDAVSGSYRFTRPLKALIERGIATGNTSIAPVLPAEIIAGSPLLVQNALTLAPSVISAAKHAGCRLVHDFDNLFWSLPREGANTPVFSTALDRQLTASDALSASTEQLAVALRRRGYDAVVLPTVVDRRDWSAQPPRAPHKRPRIGWYPPPSVQDGDVALIEFVVRALIDEVDFVCCGDSPPALADLTHRFERYVPVPLSLFPALLAALDLDIMLAPLAHTAFNECTSNLPLLQAGMVGYPVIASDIEPHRTLPVTRLPNTPAAWVAAIRERMHDCATLRREGETLRHAVHAGYLMETWTQRYLELWTGTKRLAVHA